MNIAFFLTPKMDVIFEKSTSTMRQAIERMEYHTYTAIPIFKTKAPPTSKAILKNLLLYNSSFDSI